ncbi:MAG: GIY-YIG nuclease family protein [Candidatus Kerfeldbacteria bacterium]|nr:GIY-YIG nuclease family protein [Candidatus Kerfeldbacteria bacterium]
MSCYVYVIRSIRFKRLYYGSCENLPNRLGQHNAGQVRSTRPYRPWELIRTEEFKTRGEARKREQQLKRSGVARKQLKRDPSKYVPPSSSPA